MALTVEDGTVVTGANSYVTLATAETYFEERHETLWTDTAGDNAKERALIKAAHYMQQRFRMQWKGARTEALQPLDWPRRGVDVPDFFDPFFRNVNVPLAFHDTYFVGESTVPEEVKQCQMLLALVTLDSSGNSTASLQDSIGRQTRREKVGSLEVEYMGHDEGSARQTIVYWDAMKLVEPFLKPWKPHTAELVRS